MIQIAQSASSSTDKVGIVSHICIKIESSLKYVRHKRITNLVHNKTTKTIVSQIKKKKEKPKYLETEHGKHHTYFRSCIYSIKSTSRIKLHFSIPLIFLFLKWKKSTLQTWILHFFSKGGSLDKENRGKTTILRKSTWNKPNE